MHHQLAPGQAEANRTRTEPAPRFTESSPWTWRRSSTASTCRINKLPLELSTTLPQPERCAVAPYSRRAEPASLCRVRAAPDSQDFNSHKKTATRNDQTMDMSHKALLDHVCTRHGYLITSCCTPNIDTHGNHSIPCSILVIGTCVGRGGLLHPIEGFHASTVIYLIYLHLHICLHLNTLTCMRVHSVSGPSLSLALLVRCPSNAHTTS